MANTPGAAPWLKRLSNFTVASVKISVSNSICPWQKMQGQENDSFCCRAEESAATWQDYIPPNSCVEAPTPGRWVLMSGVYGRWLALEKSMRTDLCPHRNRKGQQISFPSFPYVRTEHEGLQARKRGLSNNKIRSQLDIQLSSPYN